MRIEARFRVNGRATPLIAARRNGRLLGTRTVLQEIQSRVDLCPFVIMLSRSIKLSQRLPAHQVRSYSRSRAGNTRLSSLNKPPSVRPSNSAYWPNLPLVLLISYNYVHFSALLTTLFTLERRRVFLKGLPHKLQIGAFKLPQMS